MYGRLSCSSYAVAVALHVSGPIAIVVAGVLIGNYGPREALCTGAGVRS